MAKPNRRLAEPARDAGMITELGLRVCMELMSDDDWQHLISVWVTQGVSDLLDIAEARYFAEDE